MLPSASHSWTASLSNQENQVTPPMLIQIRLQLAHHSLGFGLSTTENLTPVLVISQDSKPLEMESRNGRN